MKYICKAWTDWKEMSIGGVHGHFKDKQVLAKHRTILHQTQGEWSFIREVASYRIAAISIRDTAYFYCDSLNYELQFIDSQ